MRQMVDERFATDQGAKQPQRIHSDRPTGSNLIRQAGHPVKTSELERAFAQHRDAGHPSPSFLSLDFEKSPAETPRRATTNSS